MDGSVAGTFYASTSRGRPTYLDFHEPYQGFFKVVIWGEDRAAFSRPPETAYDSQHICVTGTLTSYEGPEIVVTHPGQITVVGS